MSRFHRHRLWAELKQLAFIPVFLIVITKLVYLIIPGGENLNVAQLLLIAIAGIKISAWLFDSFLVLDCEMRRGMEQVASDLAPFVRSSIGRSLSFQVEDSGMCLRLSAVEPDYTSSNYGTNNAEGTTNSPPLWLSPEEYMPVSYVHASMLIHMLSPWFYPSSFSSNKFSPTNLKGHHKIDVFTWGYVYAALHKASQSDKFVRSFLITYVSFVGCFSLTYLLVKAAYISPDGTSVYWALLISFTLPLLVFELMVARNIPECHERCQATVVEVAPMMRDQCGYDLVYKVKPGWFFGSTSDLYIFPIPSKSHVLV
jgi:hypothetical protein